MVNFDTVEIYQEGESKIFFYMCLLSIATFAKYIDTLCIVFFHKYHFYTYIKILYISFYIFFLAEYFNCSVNGVCTIPIIRYEVMFVHILKEKKCFLSLIY